MKTVISIAFCILAFTVGVVVGRIGMHTDKDMKDNRKSAATAGVVVTFIYIAKHCKDKTPFKIPGVKGKFVCYPVKSGV